MASDEWSMPSFPNNEPLTNLLFEMKFLLSFRYKKHPKELHHLSNSLLSTVFSTLQSQDVQGGASASSQDVTNAIILPSSNNFQAAQNVQIQLYESFNERLKDHDAIIECINKHLTDSGWPDTEPARRLPVVLPNEVKTALHSSSKRCRDAAEESEGGDARKQTSPK